MKKLILVLLIAIQAQAQTFDFGCIPWTLPWSETSDEFRTKLNTDGYYELNGIKFYPGGVYSSHPNRPYTLVQLWHPSYAAYQTIDEPVLILSGLYDENTDELYSFSISSSIRKSENALGGGESWTYQLDTEDYSLPINNATGYPTIEEAYAGIETYATYMYDKWIADDGDGDEDGVINSSDTCPHTITNVLVDEFGCQIHITRDPEIQSETLLDYAYNGNTLYKYLVVGDTIQSPNANLLYLTNYGGSSAVSGPLAGVKYTTVIFATTLDDVDKFQLIYKFREDTGELIGINSQSYTYDSAGNRSLSSHSIYDITNQSIEDAIAGIEKVVESEYSKLFPHPITCDTLEGDYVLIMTDTYGDGWNGNYITVTIDGVSLNYGMPSPYTGSEADNSILERFTGDDSLGFSQFTIPTGTTSVTFSFTEDEWSTEIGFQFVRGTIYTDVQHVATNPSTGIQDGILFEIECTVNN